MKLNRRTFVSTVQIVIDAIIVAFSFCLALVLRQGLDFSTTFFKHLFISLPVFVLIYLLVFAFFRFYRVILRFIGMREVIKLIVASIVAVILCYAVSIIFAAYYPEGTVTVTSWLPRQVFVAVPFFVSVFAIFERSCYKYWGIFKNRKKNLSVMSGSVMIIGAGSAANVLVNDISTSAYLKDTKISCLIDDSPSKQGMYIGSAKVCGTRNDIERLAKEMNVKTIIFAIPTCPSEEKAEILKICQKTGCILKTLPAIHQLSSKTVGVDKIRSVEIEDLLGRDPIKIDVNKILDYVKDKVVMVTGGGGSIGSELCRQIASHSPKMLIIFDVYENNAYEIQNELVRKYPELNLVTLIGSVRDSKRVEAIFTKYHPDIVYHAAAHKHVPLMEDSPNEAVKNNVVGTLKTVRAADKHGVKRFVLISTDKAVNPTSVMGATKRICEMIVQTYNKISNTEFVAVRFGNVLGSNGSVIPLFKRQIAEGGPVTVTDKNMVRYFMTIPEAVSLVLQAGATAHGGEIFVLDMGKPVKICDLAENLIRLSGYIPYVDIDIKFTGLRPGEKLYEELLMSEEGLQATENDLIHIGKPIELDEQEFMQQLDELQKVMYDDNADIRALIKKIVPTCIFKEQ